MTHAPAINKTCGQLAGPAPRRLPRALIRLSPAYGTPPCNTSRVLGCVPSSPMSTGLWESGARPEGSGTAASRAGSRGRGTRSRHLGGMAAATPWPLFLSSELQEPRNSEFVYPSLSRPAASLALGLLSVSWSLATVKLGEEACWVSLPGRCPGPCWSSVQPLRTLWPLFAVTHGTDFAISWGQPPLRCRKLS